MTILIVEDENELLLKLEELIKENFKDKLTVKTVTTANNALEISKVLAIDIFVIDIDLPDMNGMKLAKHLRSRYKYQPIIFESAETDNKVKAKLLNSIHNLAYLAKPYSEKAFIEQVKMAFEISKQLKTQYLSLTYNDTATIYDINDIIYVEKLKSTKKIQVYWYREDAGLGSDTYIMSLNQLKKLLINNNRLCQIHRSFLVNPTYVAKVDFPNNNIILKYMHTTIPFGPSYINTLTYLC